MNNVPASDRVQGFVLLDALLALVLVALTFGLVAGIVGFGHRVVEAGRTRDRIADLAGGGRALAEWIGDASALRPRVGERPGPVLFEGRSDRLSFVTLNTGDALPAGLLAVTVGHAGGTQAGLLFEALPMALGESELPDMTARQLLVSHVLAARFRYFGVLTEGGAAGWHDEWTGVARLPLLVALRLELDLGRRTEPLALSFRTRAQ